VLLSLQHKQRTFAARLAAANGESIIVDTVLIQVRVKKDGRSMEAPSMSLSAEVSAPQKVSYDAGLYRWPCSKASSPLSSEFKH